MAKTTIELPDDLLAEAKAQAALERITLRELVERGLRTTLRRPRGGTRFRLRDGSVDGRGLQPEFDGAGWDRLRDAIYELDDR
jgi:Arc/MetJ family transcription regulator